VHCVVHCNTFQHTATHCTSHEGLVAYWMPRASTLCRTLQHTATHCNTLQHTATHCNTLQHTATHCNTLQKGPCSLMDGRNLFVNDTIPFKKKSTEASTRERKKGGKGEVPWVFFVIEASQRRERC